MATYQEILDEAKISLLAAIKSPKPSYSVGEFKVDRNAYMKMLIDTIKQMEELISAETPCEEITYYTDEML